MVKPKRYRLPRHAGPFGLAVAKPGSIERLCEEDGRLVAYVLSEAKGEMPAGVVWAAETERLQCELVTVPAKGEPAAPFGLARVTWTEDGKTIDTIAWAGGNEKHALYAAPWLEWVKAVEADAKAVRKAKALEAKEAPPPPAEPEPQLPPEPEQPTEPATGGEE